MIRVMSIVICATLAAPAMAATKKEKDCGYQGDVVAAVQAARVARVNEKKVPEFVAENAPDLPEKYNAVVPLVTPWVYSMKMAEVKKADLSAAWKEMCIAQ